MHTLFEHVRPGPQNRPHAPQLLGSLVRLTQTLAQRVWPGMHTTLLHMPFVHAVPAAQTLPHAPQFCGSELGSTHPPPQLILGAEHALTHCRCAGSQINPAGQSALVRQPPHNPPRHTPVPQSMPDVQVRP